MESPGRKFRKALRTHPLQIMGVPNAYTAIMAEQVGFKALYLSGAGVANISYGLPDLAVTTLDNVLEDTRRITSAVDLPLLVDIDTGWGNALMIKRTIRSLEQAGAAAVHIEDQVFDKRCGHRPGKQLVSTEEMVKRIEAAVSAKQDPDFFIIARTDALAVEGFDVTVKRAKAYIDAGADAIFAEAFATLDEYKKLKDAIHAPILANMTEFGKTPLFTLKQLADASVDMVLYPLTVARAMHQAAYNTLKHVHDHRTQKELLGTMQTRDELYAFLDYERLEKELR